MFFNLVIRIYSYKEKFCFRLYNVVIFFYKCYKILIDVLLNFVVDGVYMIGDNVYL